MTTLALKLDGVSKRYRLGQIGTGTLAHDLNRLWARLTGREDPFSKIGGPCGLQGTDEDYVWALRDIDFEVEAGEIIGIVGHNGAGKSTLLKLLSRVTAPTSGSIHINGRIASLLEVGTGFHPELTGRENIYLNGAILGMSKREIRARFDEIVEFSGCDKYIDTPVKRYSSGMYVRLAFAVAAHLETDILIVDEVLAVGDAEFQRRCVGKMQDVSRKSHRTVLFVSHNMAAMKQLCPRSILMQQGRIAAIGATEDIVDRYLIRETGAARSLSWKPGDGPRTDQLAIESIRVLDRNGRPDTLLSTLDALDIVAEYEIHSPIRNLRVSATVTNGDGVCVFSTSDFLFQDEDRIRRPGLYKSVCHVPECFLNVGRYEIEIVFEIPFERQLFSAMTVAVEIDDLGHNQMGPIKAARPLGVVHPELKWQVVRRHVHNAC